MALLTIAMATGRTAKQGMSLLEKVGIRFPDYSNGSRKLVMLDETKTIQLILVKTADLPVYVEKGAADVGVIGKDVILEARPDVYELANLQTGKCVVAVAGKPQTNIDAFSALTVATKYPQITKSYFDKRDVPIELIHLNGSIELAPLIGLSNVIVDIVETGTTLKENGLVILDEIVEVSARLIVNKASFATKTERIENLIAQLKKGVERS
ncbi:MAG TPA: ATP phosphoribosyltransferase [Sporosarcina sp.]|nr:ATP phosphoribosyltransferase [Sporosarcina sp.]